MNMQRILVVLPFYGGSLPIGRYCVEAMRETGRLVDVFEAPEFFGAFSALKNLRVGVERLEFLENAFLQTVSQAILAKVEAFEPDLVLAMAQAPLSRQALKRLRADKVPTAMWFMEDFRLFTYWRAFAPYYDVFAVIQKEPFLTELAAGGQPNTLYLPMAALPSLHRPLELSAEERAEYGADLSFLGAGYPNRRAAFARLADLGLDLKIWGTEWEDDVRLAPLVQRGGARISPEDAARIYNASKINLNLHSSVQAESLVVPGDFVNPRTFELAACGAFQLADRRSLMPELFAEDEVVQFSDFKELVERIRHFAAAPEERAAHTAKARARALAEHTYAHRMNTLLEFVAERVPDFGRIRKEPPWPADIPPELKAELQTLVRACGLPADASFEDVAMAVRAKRGRLEHLEAAVLFLDEWRKLYG